MREILGWVGGQAGQQAGKGKVRFGRNRGERQRYREMERQRDRADNKNPEQSLVAQLVFNPYFLIRKV
jgi:hypothetical protein